MTREGTETGWPPGIGLVIYRIVQEALTNTIKHAGPMASTEVRLRCTTVGVEVEITDDGAGWPAVATGTGGHGLAGITERATAYGGEVETGPVDGTGWRVRARLPRDGART
jgi:signal transduction histidine kinase